MKGVTEQEKASLYYQVLERCDDWRKIYSIAIGAERFNALGESAKQTNTSRWKLSERIQTTKAEIERNLKALIDEERQKAIEEYKRAGETEPREGKGKKTKSEAVDFLNPDEFLKFANQQANEIKDEKERREYLKMIANLMNYKEGDQEQTDIQRFYTPVLCENCVIYNKCKSCKRQECNNI